MFPSTLGATKHSRFGDDIPILQVASILVTILDDAGERNAANLPLGQSLLVLAADVFHGLGLKQHALVGENPGHVDAEEGLLHDEEASELDRVVDEHTKSRVSGLGGGGGCGRVKETVNAGQDALGEFSCLVG